MKDSRRPAWLRTCIASCAALFALSCNPSPETSGERLEVELIGRNGGVAGSASLEETPGGVRVTVRLTGMEPGQYRYALFDTPSCEPPAFARAGQPFPEAAETGMLQNMSPALDRSIGRIKVGEDGYGAGEAVAPVVTLGPGKNSLGQGGGSSLLVLDLLTNGQRRACGVIKPAG